jgi:hypothetical protein
MNETNRVVAHFLDGRVLKGTTRDFFPDRPLFHLSAIGSEALQPVKCELLKALFFVKNLEGQRTRLDLPGFAHGPGEASRGKKVAVRFRDGELLCGYTLSFDPDRPGFFLLSAEPRSNNIRVFVLIHATKEVAVGAEAEALLQRMPGFKMA